MKFEQNSYAETPDMLQVVSYFHADGEYQRTIVYYLQTRPLTHHSTSNSIVRKTDDDYANCVEFVKANDYYMTGDPEMIMCPYCEGSGNHDEDGEIECGKCHGEGMVEAD